MRKGNPKARLAMLLALALTLCLLCGAASASEAGAVARIGDQEYASLKEAIEAIPANGTATVTLLKSASCGYVYIRDGKNITLDLGGNTLTGRIELYHGYLTVKNGTIQGTSYQAINMYGSDSDTANYNSLTIASDATVEAVYAVILREAPDTKTAYGSRMDIHGRLNGNIWVMGNIQTDLASAANPSVITIHDGAVITPSEGNGVGIALQGAAKMRVDRATVTADTGIEVRAGELVVNGATITGTATPTASNPNGSGTTTTGAGIAVVQHTTRLPISVVINSGEISGHTAFYEANPQGNSSDDLKKITLGVTGGAYKAINGGTNAVYSEDKTDFITGGTFSGTFSDIAQYVPEGLKSVDNQNGTFTVKRLANVYLNGRGGNDANDGSTEGTAVKTLERALQLVADDGVIYICGTVSINADTVLNDVTFKRSSSFNGSSAVLFNVNKASLSLTGVTIDGCDIELKSYESDGRNYSDAYLIAASNGATLKIGADTQLINNNGAGAIEAFDSSVEMSGGKISHNYASADGGGIYIYNGSVTLSGGEISDNRADVCGGGMAVFDGTVTVSGAAIRDNAAQVCGGGVYIQSWDNPSAFTMTGGSITGNTYGEYYSGGGIYAFGTETTIDLKGGSISKNACSVAGESTGDAVSLYSGADEDSFPTLKLSGSPTIEGGVFLWDAETEGPVIQIPSAFTPTSPVSLAANWATEGTTVISYANGLTPNASQFAVDETKGLISDAQDAQKLNWVDKLRVAFKDETNSKTYKVLYVMPNTTIGASLAPTPVKNGYSLAGWRMYRSQALWKFDTDVVTESTNTLLPVWAVKQPASVTLTADREAVHAGQSITLSASATHEAAGAAYAYSWYRDGARLNVPSAPTLTVSESGTYTVKVEVLLDGKTSAALESNAVTCAITAHAFGSGWASDATHHWHACAGCDEKKDLALHTSDAGTVTMPATEAAAGERVFRCTVCGAALKTEAIPALPSSAPNVPKTGDSSAAPLWLALMLLSGGGLAAALYRKKKAWGK